jgi:hypothetical protein
MSSDTRSQIGCDRRILKAFYTQYVAVLLIMLVFTVGAFQRASQREVAPTSAQTAPLDKAQIGGLEIAQVFNELGALGGDTVQLEAVASVIREHDVTASISIPVNMKKIDVTQNTVEVAVAHLTSLERFFTERGVGAGSVEFVLGGPEARDGRLVIRCEGEDHDNFPL